jgi:hypothetical protein
MATHITDRARAEAAPRLRDATGDWTAAVFLDGGLMLVSFVLLCLVRESRAAGLSPRGAD